MALAVSPPSLLGNNIRVFPVDLCLLVLLLALLQ